MYVGDEVNHFKIRKKNERTNVKGFSFMAW